MGAIPITFCIFVSSVLVTQSRTGAPLLHLRHNSHPRWALVNPIPCAVFPCKEDASAACPLGSHKGEYKDRAGCPCPCCLHDDPSAHPHQCLNHDENLHTPVGQQMLDSAAEIMKLAPDEHTRASAALRVASDFRGWMETKMRKKPFDFPDRAGVLPMNVDDNSAHAKAQVYHAQADTAEFRRVLKYAGFPAVPLAVKQHGEV